MILAKAPAGNGLGRPSIERRTKVSLEEHKRRERAQAIGLFRYQLICPALTRGYPPSSAASWCARSPAKPMPTRSVTRCASRGRHWIAGSAATARGCEALVPAPRRLAARTDAQVLELAASLKRETRPARWRRWLGSCAPPR
ncbi:integrase, catalytic region domain protein, partial [Mycobacterium xenopi 4042]